MQQHREERYTYADYIAWDDANRYELIDGEVYMLDAPSTTHQTISGEIFYQLYRYLRGKTCRVFAAPYDVRLNAGADDDTVVQPDISVICDPARITERGCVGAPDMIVEIASPSTARRDQLVKFNQYRDAGVREYWIVKPEDRVVLVHRLEGGQYVTRPFGDADTVPVGVLEGCEIALADAFPPAPPEAPPKGPPVTGA